MHGMVILGGHASAEPVNSTFSGNPYLITRLYSLNYKVTCVVHVSHMYIPLYTKKEAYFLVSSSVNLLVNSCNGACVCMLQVEAVKEEARCISELTEEAFHHLVVRAHDLSLAHCAGGGDMSKPAVAATSPTHHNDSAIVEDMDDYPAHKPNLQSLSRTSRHFTPTSDKGSGDIVNNHDDSGVGHSTSKTSVGSMSDTDDSDSRVGHFHYTQSSSPSKHVSTITNNNVDMEERVGVFDYYPKTSSMAEVKRKNNMAYDDAFDVDSEIKKSSSRSSNDPYQKEVLANYQKDKNDLACDCSYEVESVTQIEEEEEELQGVTVVSDCRPIRNKAAQMPQQGTEMKTFRMQRINADIKHKNDLQYDESEAVVPSDDDDLSGVTVHQSLYGQGHGGHIKRGTAYSCMDDEDNEEYDNRSTPSTRSYGTFTEGRLAPDKEFCTASQYRTETPRREVDESVSFLTYTSQANRFTDSNRLKNAIENTARTNSIEREGGNSPKNGSHGGTISLEAGSAIFVDDQLDKPNKDYSNQNEGNSKKKKKKKKAKGEIQVIA